MAHIKFSNNAEKSKEKNQKDGKIREQIKSKFKSNNLNKSKIMNWMLQGKKYNKNMMSSKNKEMKNSKSL